MVTGNMHKNWRSSVVRFSSYASGQTDRQNRDLITILHTLQQQSNKKKQQQNI